MKKQVFKTTTKFASLIVSLFMFAFLAGFNPVWATNKDKVKDAIEDVSGYLKKKVDEFGDDLSSVQNYLENYPWKGIIREKASSGAETLKNLTLNGHHKVIVAERGEEIRGVVDCQLDSKKASALNIYRVVIGLKGEGPQTTIARSFGINAGDSHEEFVLIAPHKPGIYQIRFRTADNFFESKALDAWYDDEGNEPDATTTIGIIYVKS